VLHRAGLDVVFAADAQHDAVDRRGERTASSPAPKDRRGPRGVDCHRYARIGLMLYFRWLAQPGRARASDVVAAAVFATGEGLLAPYRALTASLVEHVEEREYGAYALSLGAREHRVTDHDVAHREAAMPEYDTLGG